MNPTTIDKELEILRALEEEFKNNPVELCDFEGCDEKAEARLICPNMTHLSTPHPGENVCRSHSMWLLHVYATEPESEIRFHKTCDHEELIGRCSLKAI